MQPPTRYIRRMVLFLLAVGVAAALLFADLQAAFMANPALNGLICGTVLIGILFAFRQVLALGPELRWAESFQSDAPSSLSSAEPHLLAPTARMLEDRKQRSKAQGRLTLSAVATRSLLDSLSARLDESRDISRYFIGLAIFLGLLGTFWGLLDTISAVAAVIGDLSVTGADMTQVFADLKDGLKAPLSGMGTAFSSSLLGLSGSLVIGFLDLQMGQAHNSFFNQVEDWLSGLTRLSAGGSALEGDSSVPAYIGALLEQTAESLTELQRLTSRSDESAITTTREIRELAQRLDILSEHMHTQQAVMLKLAENQSALLSGLENLNKPGQGMDNDVRLALKTLPRSIENGVSALLDEMTRGRSELSRDVRNEIKVLSRTVAAVADTRSQGSSQ
jgi:biopolymer transport protein ExbB/TolQ